jgi:hypothetical protein
MDPIPVALCESLELYKSIKKHSVPERKALSTVTAAREDYRLELIWRIQNLNLDRIATVLRIDKNMVRLSRSCSKGNLIESKGHH